jgi:hypothetical protein
LALCEAEKSTMFRPTLWLWLRQPWYRWPIEIDGLPNLKMDGFSWIFHGELLNNQMVVQTYTQDISTLDGFSCPNNDLFPPGSSWPF